MDIERHFSRKKCISTNVGTYDLTLCRWKSVSATSSRRKDMCNLTTQGYIHAATQLKDTVYTIVGPDENHNHNTMHSFNFRNCEWRKWDDCDLPSDRDSFGLTTHLNELYLFGGSNQIEQFGDTYVYSTFTAKWRKLDEGKHLARNPMVFADVNSEFILLYGGVDVEKGEILNDAYILVQGQWKPLVLNNAPVNLVGAKSAVCEGKVFVFGGEIQNQGQEPVPNTALYQLSITTNQSQVATLQFEEIVLPKKQRPCTRTSHSMIGLNRQNFMIIGGIRLEGGVKGQILRDMWLFNSEDLSWTRVDPANGILRGFCDSSLCLHNNKLHIIGGLVGTLDTWNEQISIIEFGQDQTIRNQICSNCQQRAVIKDREDKSFPKTVVVTVGFFYNISLEIRHPFQAIAALHRCAKYLDAIKFRFSIQRGLNDNQYVLMNWDGRSLTKNEFQQLICHTHSKEPQYQKFINMLKIASLRLGKTLLFVTTDQFYRKVFLFSADSKVCPEFDESYSYFAYIQNIQLGAIQSHEGRSHQKVILNLLKSRLSNAEEVLRGEIGSQLYIFEKNILVTSQKTYYYELIVSTQDDVTVFRNAKKLQFLEELGYSLSKQPQISLKSFVSLINLDPTSPKFYIGSEQESIESEDYLHKLADLEQAGAVSRIEIAEGGEDFQYDIWLYKAEVERLLSHNYGVMVYYQGRLVNRLDCNFGDFFKQQFFKTKYKTAETIFEVLGVINVKNGLELNYLETWFRKKKNYFLFIDNIRSGIRKAYNPKGESQAKAVVIDGDQRKIAKLK